MFRFDPIALIQELDPLASHVAVAALVIATWVFLIVPLWRRWRTRFLLLSKNNLLKKRLAAATIVFLVFAVGLWTGWHEDVISARLSRWHSELTRTIPSRSPSPSPLTLTESSVEAMAHTPASWPSLVDQLLREGIEQREHEIDQVPPLPTFTASEVSSPATPASPAEPGPSTETAVAQPGGHLIVLRAPNFGWNLALNLKIDGRTAANIVQSRRYDQFVPEGRHMLTVSVVPNYQPTSTVLDVRRGQTYVFTATRQNTDSVVLVPSALPPGQPH